MDLYKSTQPFSTFRTKIRNNKNIKVNTAALIKFNSIFLSALAQHIISLI